MTRLAILAACSVLFAAIACDGKNESSPDLAEVATTQATTTSNGPSELNAVDLEAALLRVEDLPDGWLQEPPGSTENDEGTCGLNLRTDYKISASATRLFFRSETGSFLIDDIILYEPGEAEAAMAALRGLLATCTEDVDVDASGGEIVSDLTPLDLPKLGDDSVALRVEGRETTPVGLFKANLVLIRRDQILLTIVHVSYGEGGPEVSETETIAVSALSRLETILP